MCSVRCEENCSIGDKRMNPGSGAVQLCMEQLGTDNLKTTEGGRSCVNTQTGSVEVAAPQSNTLFVQRAVPSLDSVTDSGYNLNERDKAVKYCHGEEIILPSYKFFPYKACSSHQIIDRFSFGRGTQPQEQSKDDITTNIMDKNIETGGQEEGMPGEGSHVSEDLTRHGTGVMSEPNFTTLPEKGWEGRRETDMPWAGGEEGEETKPEI